MVGHWKDEEAESSPFLGLSMNILDLLSRGPIGQSFALFCCFWLSLWVTVMKSSPDEGGRGKRGREMNHFLLQCYKGVDHTAFQYLPHTSLQVIVSYVRSSWCQIVTSGHFQGPSCLYLLSTWFFFLRWSFLLCSSVWLDTLYVDQAGVELLEIHLPLSPECWDLKRRCAPTQV